MYEIATCGPGVTCGTAVEQTRRPTRADMLAFVAAGRTLPGFTRATETAGCRPQMASCVPDHPGDGPHPTDGRPLSV